jgi:hypothetical protein
MIPEEIGFWDRLTVGEDGLPKHLPMGVDELGRGPVEPEPAHHYVCWCGDPECPLSLALQHAWASGRRKGHDDATTTMDWMSGGSEWEGQSPSIGFRATFDQELTERPGYARRQLRYQADPLKPPCVVDDCPGDGRYAPPGRGHRCTIEQYLAAIGLAEEAAAMWASDDEMGGPQ